jgi:hypothetical protein
MDPVPEPLLLRKSGSAGNRILVLWICSQEHWPLDHRGGPEIRYRVDKNPLLVPTWARSIQSIPSHPISLRSILILPSHLRICLASGHFPSGFPTNILYAFRVSNIRAKWPAHLILSDFIIAYISINYIK